PSVWPAPISSDTPSTALMTPLPPPNRPGRAAKCLVRFSTETSAPLIGAPRRCTKSKRSIRGPYGPRSRSLADARSQAHRKEAAHQPARLDDVERRQRVAALRLHAIAAIGEAAAAWQLIEPRHHARDRLQLASAALRLAALQEAVGVRVARPREQLARRRVLDDLPGV